MYPVVSSIEHMHLRVPGPELCSANTGIGGFYFIGFTVERARRILDPA